MTASLNSLATLTRPVLIVYVVLLGIIFAANLTLAVLASIVLIRRRRTNVHAARAILVIVLLLQAFSTVDFVIRISALLKFGLDGLLSIADPEPGVPLTAWSISSYFAVIIPLLSCALTNVFMAWMAWHVWERRRSVFLLLAMLFSVSVASGVYYFISTFTSNRNRLLGLPNERTEQSQWRLEIVFSLGVVIRACTACFVAYTAIMRTRMHRELGISAVGSQISRILLILLESGFIYCAQGVVVIAVTAVQKHVVQSFTVSIIGQTALLHPAAIIVLIHLFTKPGSENTLSAYIESCLSFAPAGEAEVSGPGLALDQKLPASGPTGISSSRASRESYTE